jgi:tryptophan-rich sensory protein
VARALVLSLVICAAGAGLEGLFAGRGVKQRLASLRLPAYAVPFWGWVIIGGLYYVICFAVWTRLLLLPGSADRNTAFVLLGAIMLINALWNYFFFRARNLQHAFLIGLPYGVLVVALFILLLGLDRIAAWCLFPYLVYLFYGCFWGYRIWKLNPN